MTVSVSRLQLYVDTRDIPLNIKCATKEELKTLSKVERYTDWYKACILKELNIRKTKN